MALAKTHVICAKNVFFVKNSMKSWYFNTTHVVKGQILCNFMFYTYIPNFMQMGLLVDELHLKEILDGRHNYIFLAIGSSAVNKFDIFKEQKNVINSSLKILKKNHQKRTTFEGDMTLAINHVIWQKNYTQKTNFMQIGLLVDELLPLKESQDGRHNYSFSQLAPQQLTNMIYS